MKKIYYMPYLVASSQNYTKHYYAGTERVASKIGGGGIADITTPIVSTDYKRNSWTQPYASLWNSCLNLAAPCSAFFYSLLYPVQSPETDIYFYHSDHLGSASWITDSSGRAIQHLQYLPFGETWVDQRITSTSWNTRYSFSAKEKDEESRYSYFGARYYDSELSIWLSVDPMASKYPSLTPYNYCANNPIKLVDPNGMEVEYNSFTDRVVVAFAKLFSAYFRAKFKELKKSDETYVFNHNKEGNNSFTTDGDKLFINYSIDDASKEAGQTIFSNLRHETTHAAQFEHGELAFRYTGKGKTGWEATNYDIIDEYKAHNAQNAGKNIKNNPKTNRDMWNSSTEAKRKQALQNTPRYSHLPPIPCNNLNTTKIKNDKYFALPYVPR